ncbi:type II toxin-antitoxin system VapC family toxin [Aquibium carbonis]|uniref:Ribonuclease VapC n=1 Tax=Aquibium carbonis TaxID=2495581 RepID=A0A3R9YH28_9HYPH|nr:type II toxin-antitoxin system VapC family toxin [Aquibium carbonis]
MVVDTSALIAILREESDAASIVEALGNADRRLISAGTMLEAGLVTAHRGNEHTRLLQLVERATLEVVATSEAEVHAGILAARRFGRGSGHPANLNFGDCFSYALAKTRKLPLLFKGDDFIHTDIEPALTPG